MVIQKVLSIIAFIAGFLMPVIVYQVLYVGRSNALPTFIDYLLNVPNTWLYLSAIAWCISILLWGNSSRYWIMLTIFGGTSFIYLFWYLVSFLSHD